jgi:hypothetical protein
MAACCHMGHDPTNRYSNICFGLAGLPCLWGRLGMPCMPFCSPSAFVCQTEELRDFLHIVCG